MKPIAAAAPTGSGLHYMVQAAFWFAVMATMVKVVSHDLPWQEVVFVRGCVTLALATAMLVRARVRPIGKRPGLLLLRGLLGSCGLLSFYAAIAHLPLAEATVIQQTSPLFTALLAAWLLRERLDARVLVGIATAMVGVLMIARQQGMASSSGPEADVAWQFAFVALLAAVLSAFAYVSVRMLGRSENPLVVVFYFPLVTVPLTAPMALPFWVAPDGRQWLLLLGIGSVTQIAQLNMTKGLAREPAGRATAVGYLQVAFATLFGAVVLGEWPDLISWGGMVLILASLLLSTSGRGRESVATPDSGQ